MNWCIFCIGSLGDILPFVALGVKLKSEGHQVRIASHLQAKSLCEEWGLEFALVEGDLTELQENPKIKKILHLASIRNIPTSITLMRLFREVIEVQLETSLQALGNADILIYSPTAFAGPHLAEYANIPSFRMSLQPEILTKEHSSCVVPFPKLFGNYGNFIGHFLSSTLGWLPFRKPINVWREKHLGLKKMGYRGPLSKKLFQQTQHIIACSPLLIPRPSDWPDNVHYTGFCCLPSLSKILPKSVEEFITESPTLYLGFGSMTPYSPIELTEILVQALSRRNIRCLISERFPGINTLSLPENVLKIGYLQHDSLFPKVSAVVHHGGVGTTSACLYAGKPMLVMPFIVDQFFWGKYVHEWGVGPNPLPVKKCTLEVFEERLEILQTHEHYKNKAQDWQQRLLAEEPGVDSTYQVMMQLLEKKHH